MLLVSTCFFANSTASAVLHRNSRYENVRIVAMRNIFLDSLWSLFLRREVVSTVVDIIGQSVAGNVSTYFVYFFQHRALQKHQRVEVLVCRAPLHSAWNQKWQPAAVSWAVAFHPHMLPFSADTGALQHYGSNFQKTNAKHRKSFLEHLTLLAAVRADAEVTAVKSMHDLQGLSRYIAMGDSKGKLYFFAPQGDLLAEYHTGKSINSTVLLISTDISRFLNSEWCNAVAAS